MEASPLPWLLLPLIIYLLFYMQLLLVLIPGYLLGSIPFGFIVGKMHGVDLRKEGSGSTGATNVLRIVGKKAGAIVLALDFLKGLSAPIVCAGLMFWIHQRIPAGTVMWGSCERDGLVMIIAAIACLVGHSRSIWIGFKGGKSVASACGALFALDWRVGLIAFVLWFLTVYISKYSSLGALVAATATPILMYSFHRDNIIPSSTSGTFLPSGCSERGFFFVAYGLSAAIFIFYRHQANIKRLLNGTEPKIGSQKKDD